MAQFSDSQAFLPRKTGAKISCNQYLRTYFLPRSKHADNTAITKINRLINAVLENSSA
jgi:hypothetical protein